MQALFFLAVEFGKADAVKRLLDAGAMVGAKNPAGKTAWRIAREVEGLEEEVGEVLRVLRANKSRVVGRRGMSEGTKGVSGGNLIGIADGGEEEEEEDDRKFQMSAFRRRDIFDEDESTAGIEEVEKGDMRRREPVLA